MISRKISRCLVFIMLAQLLFSATGFAADTATATVMRLESTEGTVTLKNINGKPRTISENLRLNSGDTLETAAKSYAYIALDDKKAVKLDALTQVQLKKSGKKLELCVNSGKLFFNVKSPLESDESLQIRTSTTVTGIRGTSGVVDASSQGKTQVLIFDGKVTVSALDQNKNLAAYSVVNAGEMVQVDSQASDITPSKIPESAIPGFAAVEITKDTQLQNRIETVFSENLNTILSLAEQTLQQDEQHQSITQPAPVQPTISETPGIFEPEGKKEDDGKKDDRNDRDDDDDDDDDDRDDNGDNGNGGNDDNNGGNDNNNGGGDDNNGSGGNDNNGGNGGGDVNPPTPPVNEQVHFNSPTAEQLQAAFDNPAYKTVNINGAVTIGDSFTVPKGKVLNINSSVIFDKNVEVLGLIIVNGALTVNPNCELKVKGEFILNGGFANDGKFSVGHGNDPSKVTINSAGDFTNYNEATLKGHAKLESFGKVMNSGTLSVDSDAQFINSGTFQLQSGTFICAGKYADNTNSSFCMALNSNDEILKIDTFGEIINSLNTLGGTTEIRLLNDVDLGDGHSNGATQITIAKPIELNLSGHKLDLKGYGLTLRDDVTIKNGALHSSNTTAAVYVMSGTDVTLQDCEIEAEPAYQHGSKSRWMENVIRNEGTLTLKGDSSVKVLGNAETSKTNQQVGAAVINESGGQLKFQSGSIKAINSLVALENQGDCSIEDDFSIHHIGFIDSDEDVMIKNTGINGGSDSNILISGGTFTADHSLGVLLYHAKFDMQGGTLKVTGNANELQQGVKFESTAEFKMSGSAYIEMNSEAASGSVLFFANTGVQGALKLSSASVSCITLSDSINRRDNGSMANITVEPGSFFNDDTYITGGI